MTVKLLTKHHLECLSLIRAAQARLSLHLSKYHIVGNHMSWLIYGIITKLHIYIDVPCTCVQKANAQIRLRKRGEFCFTGFILPLSLFGVHTFIITL